MIKEADQKTIEEAAAWASRQAARINKVNEKWADVDHVNMYFEDIGAYEIGLRTTIYPGIDIKVLEYNDKYYALHCWMDGDLPKHKHPRHSEIFHLIMGYMKDNVNIEVHLTAGDRHVYNPDEFHEPRGKCELLIIGKR